MGGLPRNPQDWPKKGPFFITFRKFWKISGRKRDLFCGFFKFPGPPPRIFEKNGKKCILGGLWGGRGCRFAPEMAFFGQNDQKWPKMTHFGGFGGPLGPLFGGVFRPVSDPPFWGAKWPKNWPFSHLLVLDFGQFYLHSSLKMSSFLAKIPEIWLPQTQKSVILFPITQQFFFIIGQNPEQTHVCIYI